MKNLWRVLTSRRLLVVVLLGFSSGMPLLLTAGTLQAWMKSESVDLRVIGIFSLVGLPYALKFLWSPLMDRYVPPFLGRRRGWILITQALLVVSIAAFSFVEPSRSPAMLVATAVIAFLVCFFSASQDIVIDAYRTDILETEELGLGAAVHNAGYRVAMLVSGSIALILGDHMSWQHVYLLMAAMMSVGIVASFFAPEPVAPVQSPKTLQEAIVQPFTEFFRRAGAMEIVAFVLLYKVDVVMATALSTPFMLDLGFSNTDIGAVSKTVGLLATVLGGFAAGAFMIRMGIKRSLWTFGLFQGVSTLAFMWLAHVGHSYPVMVTAIGAENFCSGMGSAAFMAFLMSICDKRFSATQYALLSSLFAFTRVVGSAPTGFMVKALGWQNFYLLCIFVMIPGLIMLTRFDHWTMPEAEPEGAIA